MKRTIGFCFMALLLICSNQLWAQSQTQSQAPGGFPAQKSVDEILTRHQPELLYVSLHLVPPGRTTAATWPGAPNSDLGGTEMVIVAATDRSMIGHKTSCADLNVLVTNAQVLEIMSSDGTTINGTVPGSRFVAPFHDSRGNIIGLIEIGLKFTTGQESEAAKFARSVQQELEAQFRSKMAMFQHVE